MWSLALVAALGTLEPTSDMVLEPAQPNEVRFEPVAARFVRFVIHASNRGQPCLDELEIYAPGGEVNLALAERGARAAASSCLPGYPIHQIPHLNDGLYGNSHSWIAAGTSGEWAQVELPRVQEVSRVVFSRDRDGRYRDRLPVDFEIQVSTDGHTWETVCEVKGRAAAATRPPKSTPPPRPDPERPLIDRALQDGDLVRYAMLCEKRTWRELDGPDPVGRVLRQMEAMLERLAAKGLDVGAERAELGDLRKRRETLQTTTPRDEAAERALFLDARQVKRRAFFRDPDLAPLERILFAKRHPFEPSHNYSVILDAQGGPGGAICRLEIPRRGGRLEPGGAQVEVLFDAGRGVARNPAASFDARKIYFGYRRSMEDYYHIMVMNSDGSGVRQLTDGPFHDYWPCPLPDGGLAFISTRARARYLCWRPQAFVLFRMEADGSGIRPLSRANLSEWAPSVMHDGRIIWTRSEYLDKGADFGHTLWSIGPDGTHPELIFGNNTRNCYANGREMPGTGEICCTLISHGGDLNGPIALIRPGRGRFNPSAIRNITPDVAAHYHMSWARRECFRDPVPISPDYILASHAPDDRFGLYVIDRFGNRELLYLDPAMGSMCPTPFCPMEPPPRVGHPLHAADEGQLGQFVVADVYKGLQPWIRRGTVKYIRVCQEVRADLVQLPDGTYQQDHEPFRDWYATPIHKVSGPYGWPSYVAKGTFGLAEVEADGSANFYAPAGKVLYLQVLDEHFNELQRMRSVVQLQPGEMRSCVGCHEPRTSAPPVRHAAAMKRPAEHLTPEPWGTGPFSYEKVVQPVWDAHCTGCHNATDEHGIDLTAALDADRVPASYRTLISRGWVHHFNYHWHQEHRKADPLSFGALRSKLFEVLDAGHYDVELGTDEIRRVKCWVDLNCPLWPDYIFRPSRPAPAVGSDIADLAP